MIELTGTRYRMESLIGMGGMGAVYRAFDTQLGRPVAVKILKTSQWTIPGEARFRREARVLASLKHPGVVRLFDADVTSDVPYIVMEMLSGCTLDEAMGRGPESPAEVLRVIRSMLDALEHVHARGLFHRDLKPSNVFLRDRAEPVLIDFGLVRACEDSVTVMTSTGELVGTPFYLPPEVVRGQPYVLASDLFQVGLIGVEMLAGHELHCGPGRRGVALATVLASLQTGTYLDLAARMLKSHGALGQALMRALASAPEDRFASAGRMRDALPEGARSAPGDAGGSAGSGDGQAMGQGPGQTQSLIPPVALPPRSPAVSPDGSSGGGPTPSRAVAIGAATLVALAILVVGRHPEGPEVRPRDRETPHGASRPSPRPAIRPLRDVVAALDAWCRRARLPAVTRTLAGLNAADRKQEAIGLARSVLVTSGLDFERPAPLDLARPRSGPEARAGYELLLSLLTLERVGCPPDTSPRVVAFFPAELRPGELAPPSARRITRSLDGSPGLSFNPFAKVENAPFDTGLVSRLEVVVSIARLAEARRAWIQLEAARVHAPEMVILRVNDALTIGLVPPRGGAAGKLLTHSVPTWALREGPNAFELSLVSARTLPASLERLKGLSVLLVP